MFPVGEFIFSAQAATLFAVRAIAKNVFLLVSAHVSRLVQLSAADCPT
jgi:hypothetical protein